MKIHLTREFDSEQEFADYMSGENRSAAAAPVITASQVVSAPVEPEITAERDADGLPWNDTYHSTPKSFTEDGLWRAKRGAADAAKAARAQFKAAGGEQTVVTRAVEMPTMPVMPVAAAAMPILSAPVSFERLIGKITGMMQRGVLGAESIGQLYGKVGATSGAQFETNETLRAALFTELCAIEPELA